MVEAEARVASAAVDAVAVVAEAAGAAVVVAVVDTTAAMASHRLLQTLRFWKIRAPFFPGEPRRL